MQSRSKLLEKIKTGAIIGAGTGGMAVGPFSMLILALLFQKKSQREINKYFSIIISIYSFSIAMGALVGLLDGIFDVLQKRVKVSGKLARSTLIQNNFFSRQENEPALPSAGRRYMRNER